MTRLWIRIFVSFWLVIALALVMTVLVTRADHRAEVGRAQVAMLRSTLDALAAQAQQALDRDGAGGLRRWLEAEVAGRPEPALLVITPAGDELLGRRAPPLPPRLREALRHAATGKGGLRRLPLRALQGQANETWLLFVPPHDGPVRRWRLQQQAQRNFFIAALLASGGVCFLLARWLTQPIRALRQAGGEIAAGNLGARVGAGVGRRRDEIGALAREFDRMAARVESLLDTQQELLRDVSHELRSPLTRLQAAIGLIRQRSGDTPDEDLDRIEREAQRLDHLIGQILSWSRLQAQGTAVRQPVDLAGLVQGVVADASFEARTRGVRVDLASLPEIAAAGDEDLLHRAFENVIRNAVAHARSEVAVRLALLAPGGWMLTVADDGPGVPDEALDRLFRPFYQAKTGHGPRGGYGLGLAIAARAIALHGGAVRASPRVPHGLLVELAVPPTADAGTVE